jgi:hypothetical protein
VTTGAPEPRKVVKVATVVVVLTGTTTVGDAAVLDGTKESSTIEVEGVSTTAVVLGMLTLVAMVLGAAGLGAVVDSALLEGTVGTTAGTVETVTDELAVSQVVMVIVVVSVVV